MKKFLKYNWANFLLVAILILAAYLRLYRISDYMTFLGDEGRDVLVVKHMLIDHKFTLLGPTASVGGFFLGPIYYYFMLPFLWLWHLDPSGPAVMVALFGIATVYLVYRLGKDFLSPEVGLVAAGLYTLSPVVIAYSRSSWNPNLVPFFATWLIYLLWLVTNKNKSSLYILIGITLGIGLQLHYLFLFLGVLSLVWLLWQRSLRLYFKKYFWVVFGFLIGYSPFLAFEIRHGFPNTQSIIRFIFAGKETGISTSFLGIISDIVYRMFGRLVFRLPQPEILSHFSPFQLGLWIWGIRLAIVLSLSILMIIAIPFFRKRSEKLFKFLTKITPSQIKGAQLLLLWLVLILVLFGFYKKAIYDYYFGIFFSLPFILTGVIFWFLGQKKIFQWLILPILGGLLWLNWQGRPFLSPPNRQLAQAKMIASEAFAKTEGKPFNFALVADYNSDHAYRYFFDIWRNPPVTIENTEVDPKRQTVTDQLIVICEKADCQPLGNPLWEIAGFGRAEIVGSWQVSFVKIYKLVHYVGKP